MRLNINPNRMELLRLRKRLVLAERGHKLLKDKLEEIMRRFLEILGRLNELEEEVAASLDKAFLSFGLARTRSSLEELGKLIPEGKLDLEVGRAKVVNLTIPRFKIKDMEVSDYSLINTESELDIGIQKLRDALPALLEMASLWKAVELLSEEIEATRRRVNALEHILIPNIRETSKYISGRLDEMERSFQVQLMRVKEIIRSH